jgi:ribosomal protein L30/L7E
MFMLAVLRLRGEIKTQRVVLDTLKMLRLDKKHALSLVDDTPSARGMIRKVEGHITWGEASEELVKKFGKDGIRLKPPLKGFKSIKNMWPKGDLGYRGDKINELVKRMMVNEK